MISRENLLRRMVSREATSRINKRHRMDHRVIAGNYVTFQKERNREKLEVFNEYLEGQKLNYERKLKWEMEMYRRRSANIEQEGER